VEESGLPAQGLNRPYCIALADLDRDGAVDIVTLHGDINGSIIVWKRR